MNLNNSGHYIGRLTADPEQKEVGQTTLATFTLAIERPAWGDRAKVTDFWPVKMWGKQAEAFCKFHSKGKTAHIVGSAQIDEYEKDGERKKFHYLNADGWGFIYSDKPKEPQNDPQRDGTIAEQGNKFGEPEEFNFGTDITLPENYPGGIEEDVPF